MNPNRSRLYHMFLSEFLATRSTSSATKSSTVSPRTAALGSTSSEFSFHAYSLTPGKDFGEDYYNMVAQGVQELCQSTLDYVKDMSQKKENGSKDLCTCPVCPDVGLLLKKELSNFRREIQDDFQKAMQTFSLNDAKPVKIAGGSDQDCERVVLKDLELFFSIENCARNPWICIPWAILVLIAFGSLIAIVVFCLTCEYDFGYRFRKQRYGNSRQLQSGQVAPSRSVGTVQSSAGNIHGSGNNDD